MKDKAFGRRQRKRSLLPPFWSHTGLFSVACAAAATFFGLALLSTRGTWTDVPLPRLGPRPFGRRRTQLCNLLRKVDVVLVILLEALRPKALASKRGGQSLRTEARDRGLFLDATRAGLFSVASDRRPEDLSQTRPPPEAKVFGRRLVQQLDKLVTEALSGRTRGSESFPLPPTHSKGTEL